MRLLAPIILALAMLAVTLQGVAAAQVVLGGCSATKAMEVCADPVIAAGTVKAGAKCIDMVAPRTVTGVAPAPAQTHVAPELSSHLQIVIPSRWKPPRRAA